MSIKQEKTDVLVIGSGLAGLMLALKASRFAHVTVATKKELAEANTNYAQGGIAAAIDSGDSFKKHVQDTIVCGQGLCDPEVVRRVINDGPALIRELEAVGAHFNKTAAGKFDLGLEGGHSHRRIVRAQDLTGREIERALNTAVRQEPNIRIVEHAMALDLLLARPPESVADARDNRVHGALLLDLMTGSLVACRAKIVVLASGGAGKVYLITTNPEIATGDGMAIAYRAGCALSNLEFVQFHPTCLFHPQLRNFLISEAVRGEGGVLRNNKGMAFMPRYDKRAELAPRDIVARAIDKELKAGGAEFVYLDISHKPAAFIRERFPNIYKKLLDVGIDMAKEPIPVAPAAHYFCGGVKTDHAGRSDLAGLYAIGEVACTNFHGANRLASNSLLEACAFGHYAADAIKKDMTAGAKAGVAGDGKTSIVWGDELFKDTDKSAIVAHSWDEVRRVMTNYVGIVRSESRLNLALKRLKMIEQEIYFFSTQFRPTRDLAELVNILLLANLIARSAAGRKESRGLHYMLDYPKKKTIFAKPTVLCRY